VIERLLRKRARAVRARGLPALACFPLDSIGREIVSDGFYEHELLEALFEGLFPGCRELFSRTIALDVGANIGNHTCFFAPRFARVHAFEVNPTAAHILQANVGFNRFGNVRVHTFGLGDRSDRLPFEEFREGNLGRSHFRDPGQSPVADGITMLPVEPFDAIEAELGMDLPVSLVKIDVEGFERKVIAGMSGMLARDRPFVLFESHSAGGPEGGAAIFGLLRSLGYRRFVGVECPGARDTTSRARLRDAIGGRQWRLAEIETPEDRFHQLIVAIAPQRA
jgi:FkbM family methyltransferase